MGTAAVAVVYPDNLSALGVCRGLGARGVPVTLLRSSGTAPGQYSRYARAVSHRGASHGADVVDTLVDFARTQDEPPVLYVTDDASVLALNRRRDELDRWYRLTQPPWPILRQVMLKDRLYQALDGIVPVPRTAIPVDESELARAILAIGYPALVKPVLRCFSEAPLQSRRPFESFFGSKAVRVRSFAELTRAYRAARARGFPVVVQEEIEGPVSSLYSLALYATRNGVLAATFTSQKLCQVPPDFGDGLVVRAARVPELLPLAQRVVDHFGYYGMADIEFKWDPRAKTFKLLDINPRPWLWINLPTVCGVNLPYVAYLDAVGGPIDRTAFVQRDFETRWISVRGLLVYLVRALASGRAGRGIMAVMRHLRGPRVGPFFSSDDLLFRMFMSPRFWGESIRQAMRKIRHLPAMNLEG